MKPPLTLLPLLLLLPTTTLSQQFKNCPFGAFSITFKGKDIDTEPIWAGVFTPEPGETLNGLRIGDPIVEEILDSKAEVIDPTTYNVTLTPKQPKFADKLDYEGYDSNDNFEPSDGLLITVNTGSGEVTYRCVLYLSIEDTNNREPTLESDKELSFPISSSWDTKLPLNWETKLLITDWDFTPVVPSVDVTPNNGLLEFRVERTGKDPPGYEYNVLVFLKDTPPVGHHEYTLTANDGVPHEDAIPVQLVLDVEEIKDHEPRFATDPYVVVLDSMPDAGDELEIELKAIDPDDKFNGKESTFTFAVDPDSFVTVPPNSNKIVFTTSVPELAGTIVEVGLTATQDNNENDQATSLLKIHFPPRSPPKFSTYYVIDFEWPEDEDSRRKPLPLPEDGSSVIYELGKTSAPGAVSITDLEIVLADDFDTENLGELGDNKVVILEVKAYHGFDVHDEELFSLFTVVLSFPVDPVTEPTTTEGTTECPVCPTDPTEPTTSGVTECPEPPPCPTEPTTTGSESTDCPVCPPTGPTDPTTTSSGTTDCPECPTCPTDPTTSTTECPVCPTDPTTTGTSDCPEPTPCPTEPTTTECPICPPTGPTDPTTSGTTDYTGSTVCPEPPACPTDPTGPTECPPTPCPTDPTGPTETTTSGSTDSTGSTVCPEPPPCPTDSTTSGSTCPECPDCPTTSISSQSTDPTQTDFTCSPCPSPPECGTGSTEFTVTSTDTTCDCGITSSDGCPVVTCPTQPGDSSTTRRSDDCDCDDEDDDCSTTGLVAGIITTSILAVTGICAAGYMFYLLRRSTPTLSTESLIDSKPHMEVESPPTPPVQNRFTPQDSGYSNTSLIYDEPVITPEPITQTEVSPVTPVVTDPPPVTSSDPQPKKSNMKPPKEIEPDYEEVQPTQTSETPKTGETPQRKHSTSRVLFAQDDDVRVINEPEPTTEVVSDFEEASDVENERL